MLKSRRLWAGLTLAGALAITALCLTSAVDGQGFGKKQPVFRPGGKVVIQPGGPMAGPPGGFPGGPKQPGGPPGDGNPATHFSAIKLIENDKVQQYLDLAREYIAGKEWSKAVTALQ